MTAIDTYLTFDGNCAEAMNFYQSTLGGELSLMTMGESPMGEHATGANAGRIMHARLMLDGHMLMASDTMAGGHFDGMHGFSLSLTYASVADAVRVFDAFAHGGKVGMPMQQTFWVERFGMVTDRFGTPWMINGGKPTMRV